jgi:hypothetical protein
MTVQELADRVLEERQAAWDKADPKTAIVATEHLNPDDERVVRRLVAAAGYVGKDLEEMVRQVSARVVGRVEALADNMPVVDAD